MAGLQSILQSAGVSGDSLSGSSSRIVLDCPASLKWKLDCSLRSSKSDRESFLRDLEQEFENSDQMMKYLSPFDVHATSENSRRWSVYDSLAKILLSVECIQPQVIALLIQKLQEEAAINSSQSSLPKLLLHQLRWLDCVVDSEFLTNKLIEAISTVDLLWLKKEIIALLPELIDDSQHDTVVIALQELMTEDSEIASSVLSAYSNLHLQRDLLMKVTSDVMHYLPSVQADDVPSVMKFLLDNTSPNQAVAVVHGICETLAALDNADFSDAEEGSAHRKSSPEAVVLDTIRTCLRVRKELSDAFVQEISSPSTALPSHVWVLLCLGSIDAVPAEKLFIQKMLPKWDDKFWTSCILGRSKMLGQYLPTLRQWARTLIQNKNSSLRSKGCLLFVVLFETFGELSQRQDILADIVTHCGSQNSLVRSAGIKTLLMLVSCFSGAKRVAEFIVFLENILDYMDQFSDYDCRRLCTAFCAISKVARGMEDKLRLMMRKQLCHVETKVRRFGVICAISYVGAMGGEHSLLNKAAEDARLVFGEASPERVEAQRTEDCKQVLDQVWQACEGNGELLAFSYDELDYVFETCRLQDDLLESLGEMVQDQLEQTFVVDFNEKNPPFQRPGIKPEYWYNLDGSDTEIAIGILPSVVGAPWKIQYLFSLSRVVLTATRVRNHSVGEIDGILGCPLLMYDRRILNGFESLDPVEQKLITTCTLCAINWVRELVNGFSQESSHEMKMKVRKRIENLQELERIMEDCCRRSVIAVSTVAVEGEETERGRIPTETNEKKSKQKLGDSSSDSEDGCESVMTGISTTVNKKKGLSSKKRRGSSAAKASEFDRSTLRPLRLSVSRILVENDVLLRQTSSGLQPVKVSVLCFLLKDLHCSLNRLQLSSHSSIRVNSRSKQADSGAKSIQEVIDELGLQSFVALRNQLERCAMDLQKLFECEDDGDKIDQYREAIFFVCECFKLVVLAGCNALTNEPLKQVLACLGSGSVQPQCADLLTVTKGVFDFFEKFVQHAPLSLASASALIDILIACVDTCERDLSNRNTMSSVGMASSVILDDSSTCSSSGFILAGDSTATERIGKLRHRIASCIFRQSKGWEWTLLRRKWPQADLDKGADLIANTFVRYIRVCANPSKGIDSFVLFLEKGKEMCLAPQRKRKVATESNTSDTEGEISQNSLATITPKTFVAVYTGVLSEAVRALGIVLQKSKTTQISEVLSRTHHLVVALQTLTSMVKCPAPPPRLLQAAMKQGRYFVELMTRQAVPILERALRHSSIASDAHNVLKGCQKITRLLQYLCEHGKIERQNVLVSQVPPLKRALEAFLYKVKVMCASNDSLGAFWLGNLKHRTIDGEEVSSQLPRNAGCESGAEEDDEKDDTGSDGGEVGEDTSSESEESDGAGGVQMAIKNKRSSNKRNCSAKETPKKRRRCVVSDDDGAIEVIE